MNNSYNDASEKREYERIDLARLGMYTALNYIRFKEKNTERARRAIETILQKMFSADTYKDKVAKKSLLSKKLKGENEKGFISATDVLKSLESGASGRYKIRWVDPTRSVSYGANHDKLFNMATTITRDPATALLVFANDYTNALFSLEQDKKRKEEQAKREAEEARKAREEAAKRRAEAAQRQEQTRDYTYEREPVSSYTPRSYTGSDYSTSRPARAVSTEYIQAEIDKKLEQKNPYLGYELRRQIQAKYSQLDGINYYGEFYGADNIEAVYRFYVMSDKSYESYGATMRYNEIIELGTIAVDIVFKDLMNGYRHQSTKMAQFMRQFEPHQTLEKYAKARERYMKLYNGLNAKEKSDVDRYAAKFDRYQSMFGLQGNTGKDIATVEDIKKVVNKKVRERYKENNLIPFENDGKINVDFPSNFSYSLQYMSTEEIISLYGALKDKYTRDTYYSLSDEEKQRMYEMQQKRFASLQELCAEVIRRRLTNSETPKNWEDEQARKEYLTQREVDLIAICREVFREEPAFDVYMVKKDDVKKGYGAARLETAEAIKSAQRRYYGMGKVEQVLATLNFRKLRELSEKTILSQGEMEQVQRMF